MPITCQLPHCRNSDTRRGITDAANTHDEVTEVEMQRVVRRSYLPAVLSQDNGSRVCSYTPADTHEAFANTMARMSAAKPEIMRRQKTLLEQRYDLGNHAAQSFFNMIQQLKLAPQVKADLVAFLRAL